MPGNHLDHHPASKSSSNSQIDQRMSTESQVQINTSADSIDARPSPTVGETVFRPRRYHTKSRNGCFNCKKRRIKCNEVHPECSNCGEKGLSCEYPSSSRSPQSQTVSIPSQSRRCSRSRHSPPRDKTLDHRIAAILDEDDVPGEILTQQGYQRSDVYDLLDHFVNLTNRAWIGCPWAQHRVQSLVRREAASAPYLLYSALAFSAAHMHHLDPASSKYRVAAPYHYQHSLRRYSDKLNAPLLADDAEALLASCQLHAFLAFSTASSTQDELPGVELGWVQSMRGIRFIVQAPQLMESIQSGSFGPLITMASNDWQSVHAQHQLDPKTTRVATDLRQLQVLGELCIELPATHRDALVQAISMLRDVAQLKPAPQMIGTCMAWINRLPTTVIELLKTGDSVAVLTLGLWCALFSRIDEWWIAQPARGKCQKVCEYIDSLHDSRYDEIVTYLRSFS